MKTVVIILSILILALAYAIAEIIFKSTKPIPEDFKIVSVEDKFIIMNKDSTKFLVYWDDESYSFEDKMGDLICDTKWWAKQHVFSAEKYFIKKNKKDELMKKIKNLKNN